MEEQTFSEGQSHSQKKKRWKLFIFLSAFFLLMCLGIFYAFESEFFEKTYTLEDVRTMTTDQFETAVFNLSTDEKKFALLSLHKKAGGEIGSLMSKYISTLSQEQPITPQDQLMFWDNVASHVQEDALKLGWSKEAFRDMVRWQILRAELTIYMIPDLWKQKCAGIDCHDLSDDEVVEKMKHHEVFDFSEKDIIFAMQELKR